MRRALCCLTHIVLSGGRLLTFSLCYNFPVSFMFVFQWAWEALPWRCWLPVSLGGVPATYSHFPQMPHWEGVHYLRCTLEVLSAHLSPNSLPFVTLWIFCSDGGLLIPARRFSPLYRPWVWRPVTSGYRLSGLVDDYGTCWKVPVRYCDPTDSVEGWGWSTSGIPVGTFLPRWFDDLCIRNHLPFSY